MQIEKLKLEASEATLPDNYDEISTFKCPECGSKLTVGEYECIGCCSDCYEKELEKCKNAN